MGEAVTVCQTDELWSMSNGAITVRFDRTGRLVEFYFRGLDLLGRHSRSSATKGGYWSISESSIHRSDPPVAAWLVDPRDNGGERAILSFKFPPAVSSARVPLQIDLRYALGRGRDSLFAYAVLRHRPGLAPFVMTNGRFALKLNPEVFDFLTVDQNRRRLMPSPADWRGGTAVADVKEARLLVTGPHAGEIEDKYGYAALLHDAKAYGWSSTSQRIGLWLINPSIEYIAGGPAKVELTGHLDTHPTAYPTLLNVWKGTHYGGSCLSLALDEDWSKTIGPFALYCNSSGGHDELWQDAMAQAQMERRTWPYAWAGCLDVHTRRRVTGRIVLRDPIVKQAQLRKLCVGLTFPDYQRPAGSDGAQLIDWQLDGKHYQYWAQAASDGTFEISHVRPGNYTLRAFASGVLGELSLAHVAIGCDQDTALGPLTWEPRRFGPQLWEIGYPDRTAGKFRHGDHFWRAQLHRKYAQEFPEGVRFRIGQSDFRTDWNYAQLPQVNGGAIDSSRWSIEFDVAQRLSGRAVLRLAIAGSRAPWGIEIEVNGRLAGRTGPLPETGAMHRRGVRGYWCERRVEFDADLLRPGLNTIDLLLPARHWTHSVLYDYVRLEHVPPEGDAVSHLDVAP